MRGRNMDSSFPTITILLTHPLKPLCAYFRAGVKSKFLSKEHAEKQFLNITTTCYKMYLCLRPNSCLLVLIFLFCESWLFVHCSERDMTISVSPGREECFYEPLKAGQTFEIDYQVIDGGQGELDITFTLMSPAGRVILMDYKKPENNHRHEIAEEGDYRLCFDNSFSSFNSKTVFFEIMIDADEDEREPWDDLSEEQTQEEQYELTIQVIEEAVKKVKSHLMKVRHLQETARAYGARDIHVIEEEFKRVNYWSMLQIIVMIVVGIIQVVMVKSLFDEQSVLHKLWKSGWR